MNLSPEVVAEIFKQSAFISALIAGFSFTFLAVLLTSSTRKPVDDWTAGFAIAAVAGLIVCALGWTLCVPPILAMTAQAATTTPFQLPEKFRMLHRLFSLIFLLCFFLFLTSLGLCGWIRSKKLGIVSTTIAVVAAVFAIWMMRFFVY
jgi:hypothetical protein